ncbi:Ig-like domain-containing protein [Litoreibacter arenae]|uniref:Calx-beta domain-containing protein n=1 Tax=Litoreibacter arenae DSM 19593 TaxID=1123360 RepID=S9RZC6_9RHOB|nr:cadherin-like domain-containing protein [Litoreibacter arenae]EPX79334.1 hypothetical protein thalar_02159 [Litoreibacter arenae DSM 19593]
MPISESDAVLAGTFLARAVYGGPSISDSDQWLDTTDDGNLRYGDNYRGYLNSINPGWQTLTDSELGGTFFDGGALGGFTSGGLYVSNENGLEINGSEALLARTIIDGQDTLVLAFRGSDGADAIGQLQTFTPSGTANYYRGLQPIVDAALDYVKTNNIQNFVVSGHSLGGTMVDTFMLVDSKRFEAVEGLDMSAVSIASAGVDPYLGQELAVNEYANLFEGVLGQEISSVGFPSYYVSINHTQDRVYYAADDDGIVPLIPNDVLINNINSPSDFDLQLPNIDNSDVGGVNFGAEHNIGLYWTNVQALVSDPLYDHYVDQEIIMGVDSYSAVPDYGDGFISLFRDFRGSPPDDLGDRAINGTGAADYILGLAGNDRLAGEAGDDLISGGRGRDQLFGGDDADRLHGGRDGDLLRGEVGNDTLDGGQGADQVYGDEGDDILIVGMSDGDELYGGSGADRFVFGPRDFYLIGSIDVIFDYNLGNTPGEFDFGEGDVIDVSALTGDAYGSGVPGSELVRLDPTNVALGTVRQVLQVDIDGAAGPAGWLSIAEFQGLPATNDALIVHFGDREGGPTSPTTIPANSPAGSFQITPAEETIVEGNTSIEFTITRPDDSAEQTVYVSTTVDRGSSNGGDYDGILNRAVTFAPGDAEATVDVRIRDDNSREAVETFGLIVQSSPDQPASQYLASASFSIIDDDAAGGSVNFTNSSNQEWITPAGGTESFDGEGGTDQVTLDLREWSSVSTSTSGATRSFIGPEGRLNFVNVEQFVVIGTPGNDNIVTGDGNDVILGGDGNDQIDGGAGVDAMSGGDGNDTFLNVGVLDIVSGGEGFDTVRFNASSETQNVTIDLGTGQGLLGSWTGIEQVSGSLGSGNDSIIAGAQTQNLGGGLGEDFLRLDYSNGLAGPGGRVAAAVELNLHRETSNSSSNEIIRITDVDGGNLVNQSIQLNGFETFDITATDGNDEITTAAGDDRIIALGGDDVIDAGEGDDTIEAGAGDDVVTGGGGDDVFIMRPGESDDIITDFQKGIGAEDGDKIDISAYGFSFSDIVFETEAGGLRIRLGTDSILLQGSSLLSLDSTDFDGLTLSNLPPSASAINAGSVSEDGSAVGIDLLGDAGASDSDGGTLGVTAVSAQDQNGAAVSFELLGAVLSIDASQFAEALSSGESTTVTVSYSVTDGQGGETPNTATLIVDGLDGPFTWYLDGDGDGFGVDDAATNQSAYAAPAGTSGIAGDAFDDDDTIYPGAPEINDFKDNDQDGLTDEDNTAPVADAETFEIAEDGTLVLPVSSLLDGDTDVDGDTLTVASVSDVVNGSVALDDKGDADPTNDEVIFTPDAGYDGPASFDYSVADGFGGEDTVTVDVTVNAAPTTTTETREFADGRVLATEFVDGIRTTATMTDAADVRPWTSYVDTFDEDGDRSSRVLAYDDGRISETSYVDGVRSEMLITDAADEFVWATIAREYNASGQRSQQTNVYDDGRTLETDYTDGIRTTATMTDAADVRPWTSYVDTFDENGDRVSRITTFDDGTEVSRSFADDFLFG